MSASTLEIAVEEAIKGGCTVVQLREKDISSFDFYSLAVRLKRICHDYKIPFIINDRVDIALAVDADGVHVGQSDLPANVVRSMIGPDKILGVSASTLEEAIEAKDQGADYLGVGAMFATDTKLDANLTSMETLAKIRERIDLPIVVIGGINEKTIPKFMGMKVDGFAVVSAIIAQPDIEVAAKRVRKTIIEVIKGGYYD